MLLRGAVYINTLQWKQFACQPVALRNGVGHDIRHSVILGVPHYNKQNPVTSGWQRYQMDQTGHGRTQLWLFRKLSSLLLLSRKAVNDLLYFTSCFLTGNSLHEQHQWGIESVSVPLAGKVVTSLKRQLSSVLASCHHQPKMKRTSSGGCCSWNSWHILRV